MPAGPRVVLPHSQPVTHASASVSPLRASRAPGALTTSEVQLLQNKAESAAQSADRGYAMHPWKPATRRWCRLHRLRAGAAGSLGHGHVQLCQCGLNVRVEVCVCDWCGCRVCAGVWGRCVSVHTAVWWCTLVQSVSREGNSYGSQTPLWNGHGPRGPDELEQPPGGLVTWRPGSEGRGGLGGWSGCRPGMQRGGSQGWGQHPAGSPPLAHFRAQLCSLQSCQGDPSLQWGCIWDQRESYFPYRLPP